jgi:hypothetical protein
VTDNPAPPRPPDPDSERDEWFWTDGPTCEDCRHVLPPGPYYFACHFEGRPITCYACGEAFDWWARCLSWLERMNDFPDQWGAFSLVGAVFQGREVPLKQNEVTTIRFADWDVPPTAEIVSLEYTTIVPGEQRGPFPCEMPTNGRSGLRPIRHVHNIYGANYGNDLPLPAKLSVGIRWIPPGPDEIPRSHLAEAAKHLAAGRYASALLPSNVAVESKLCPVLTAAARQVTNHRFRQPSYDHYLNVMTPLVARLLGAPDMPEHIRTLLNSLRAARNQLAHTGALREPLTKARAFLLVAGAAFGYQYACYLERKFRAAEALRQGQEPLPMPGPPVPVPPPMVGIGSGPEEDT